MSLSNLNRIFILTLVLGLAGTLVAQDKDKTKAPEKAPATTDKQTKPNDAKTAQPKPAPKEASQSTAEEVLNQLLRDRNKQRENAGGPNTSSTDANNSIKKGIAPNIKPTKLKREGQFIMQRRGRMIADGKHFKQWMFVFESDKNGMADPPMYLMPCRYLEDMERIVKREGDSAVFILSGQIFVYRGANYLLPTIMQQAVSRNNLKP